MSHLQSLFIYFKKAISWSANFNQLASAWGPQPSSCEFYYITNSPLCRLDSPWKIYSYLCLQLCVSITVLGPSFIHSHSFFVIMSYTGRPHSGAMSVRLDENVRGNIRLFLPGRQPGLFYWFFDNPWLSVSLSWGQEVKYVLIFFS